MHNSLKFTLDQAIDNPEFERIEQNIRNFLRSEQLSQVKILFTVIHMLSITEPYPFYEI